MTRLIILAVILLAPFNVEASCSHKLCVKEQTYLPDFDKLTITRWDGRQMRFKFYSHDGKVSGLTIKSFGRSYHICGELPDYNEKCDGSVTTFRKGWGGGSVELPQYDPKASFIFDKACRCAEYREPTMLEKLKGFEKPF